MMNKFQSTNDACNDFYQGVYMHRVVREKISGGQAEVYGPQTSYSTLATYDVRAVIFSLAYTIVKNVSDSANFLYFAIKPRLDAFCVKFTF